MKFGRQVMPLKMTSMPHFNLMASAIPKWWMFELLKWVQRNPFFPEVGCVC
jgi:hypothetical protein